jgi:hypothetical protein
MSPNQGFFESDDDYRSRVAQEANERTIENSTGSAPSQGFFESEDSYRDRVTHEANEHRIEDSAGTAPSQGWFESDDSYHDRIAQEANERTIEDSTGSAPSHGWFESNNDYDTRIRKEANEHMVEGGNGSAPKQGWFEGDQDYRRRIAHEAREIRADEQSKPSTGGDDSSDLYYSPSVSSSTSSSTNNGVWLILAVVIGAVFMLVLGGRQRPEPPRQQSSQSEAPPKQITGWAPPNTYYFSDGTTYHAPPGWTPQSGVAPSEQVVRPEAFPRPEKLAPPNNTPPESERAAILPDNAVMSATTEGTTQGEEEAPTPVVNTILESLDSAELNGFHKCTSSNNISQDELNKRFVSIKLPAINQYQQLFFVRSAGQPCGFYGAHYFTYWLVLETSALNDTTYTVRYRGGADIATILKSTTLGFYDIKSEYCTAVYCDATVLKFDGEKYAATTCMETNNPGDNNKVYHSIPCNN